MTSSIGEMEAGVESQQMELCAVQAKPPTGFRLPRLSQVSHIRRNTKVRSCAAHGRAMALPYWSITPTSPDTARTKPQKRLLRYSLTPPVCVGGLLEALRPIETHTHVLT